MTGSAALRFFQRPYPSANSILLLGPRPILVDTGCGSDAEALDAWLRDASVPPERLALVVNTHFHSDHCGGNHHLSTRYGVSIAAAADEAALVNACDPDACRAWWLDQPVEPYVVQQALCPGDVIDTGLAAWQVVATPGHTAGHLSLYAPARGLLVLGDALHDADVGWINPWREGEASLAWTEETMARLASLPAQCGYSGHGSAIQDFPAALARARRRLALWRERPEQAAWHAAKRIFAHALMLADGIANGAVLPALLAWPWVHDMAARPFGLAPGAFAERLVAEMLRAGAARWQERRLVPVAAYTPPPPGWPVAPARPTLWGDHASPSRL